MPRELCAEPTAGLSAHGWEEDILAVTLCQKPDVAITISKTSRFQRFREEDVKGFPDKASGVEMPALSLNRDTDILIVSNQFRAQDRNSIASKSHFS
jgi:hypothetical protein